MSHYYTEAGKVYPSVTTILNETLPKPPQIENWQNRLRATGIDPDQETRRSQIVGTLAHYRCLNKLGPTTLEIPLDEVDECTQDMFRDIELCELMFDELLPELNLGYPRLREHIVINRDEKYAGKFDLLAPSGGKPTLFDIKTSRRVYETHLLQLGGYAAALWSNDVDLQQAAIVSLHYNQKNNPTLRGSVTWVDKTDLEKYAADFIRIVREYWSAHHGEHSSSEEC